ncbi:MAG: hypothetical protein MJ240_01120 [Kiritimatiellae bacterium]|nr:hypothetical protein [Kiritimatiellia bacterium]
MKSGTRASLWTMGVALAASWGAWGVDIASFEDTLTINEPTNVVVEAGTVTWNCRLEGNGTITKSGAGTLLVQNTNTNFSGEWIVERGELKSGSMINKVVPFFGTGKITVHASTSYTCSVTVWTSILPNDIEVVGPVSMAYPPLQANNQASFGGLITATDGLAFYQTGYSSGAYAEQEKLKFEKNGRIYAPGQKVLFRPNAQFCFWEAANTLVCGTLETDWNGSKGLGSVRFNSSGNVIGTIRTSMARILCGVNNCLGGAALEWFGQDFRSDYTVFRLTGTTAQQAAYLVSDECPAAEDDCYRLVSTDASKTAVLTLTGGVETATAYCQLDGNVTLNVAPTGEGAFRQRLLNRRHTMTGAITVANAKATLALGGGTLFPNVTTVQVNGGVLELEADTDPFKSYAVALTITNGGKVKLPAGVNWRLASLMVDGEERVGEFRSGDASGLVLGEGSLISLGADPLALVWKAEDPNAVLSVRDNWEDVSVFDFSVPNKYQLLFAKADTAATKAVVDGAYDLNMLSFDAPTADGFRLTAGSDSAAIALGSGGLATAEVGEGAAGVDYAVEVPVTTTRAQTWNLAENTCLALTNFTAEAAVSAKGHGTALFSGTTTLDADLVSWGAKNCASTDKTTDDLNRTLIFTGTVAGEGKLQVQGWNGCKLVLSNAVVSAPMKWQGDGSHSWAYNWFTCPAGTTNEISGPVTCDGASYLVIGKNAQLTISGGMTFGNKISVNKDFGTLILTGKPVVSTTAITDNNAFLGAWNANSRLVLDVAGNTFARLMAQAANSVVEFRADNAVAEDCVARWQRNCISVDDSSADGLFELNGTRQRFRFINGQKANRAKIHGVEPATLEVFANSTNRSQITGWVTLEKNALGELGVNDALVLGQQAFASYGDLKVSAGSLEFETGATWLNGTNVTVCGTGTLRLHQGGVFAGAHAVLHVGEEGLLALDAGVTQAFAVGWVENAQGQMTRLPAGTYSAANPGALAGHFAEGSQGSITIRRHGFRLTLM